MQVVELELQVSTYENLVFEWLPRDERCTLITHINLDYNSDDIQFNSFIPNPAVHKYIECM